MDALTFKVHLIQPFSSLANLLAIGFSGIIPEGIVTNDMLKRPYGSGPFKVDFKTSQRAALWNFVRNPDYFKPGLPYLDGWTFVLMDGTAIVQAAFLTRKIDVGGGHPTEDNKAIYEKKVASGEIYRLIYSSDCRPQGLVMNSTKPPFNDLKLRQAVNLGIDREAYTTVVHDGYAQPEIIGDAGGWGMTVEEARKLPGFRQPHTADQEEAKRVIRELYPSGLDVKMMTRNSSGYMRQGEMIAGELRKLGINVTVDPQDTSVVFGRAEKLDYTLWNYWFCQTTNTPEELIGSYFITGGSRNWMGYSNPVIDKGYLDMAAISDPVQKKKKMTEMIDTIYAFLPYAPLTVHTTSRNAYSFVQDLPLGITQYSREKNELIWRSDI
ncbi:MAG: ABC transporter substrate-binding protein [Chloroflexi bacterium]|nr:ABC transporter substrate-binding protein [Chloroflexota bacterium]